jgi:hypothetical protein
MSVWPRGGVIAIVTTTQARFGIIKNGTERHGKRAK